MTQPSSGQVAPSKAGRLKTKRVTVNLDSSLAIRIAALASALEISEDELINDMLELARTSRKFIQYQRSELQSNAGS